jgi:5'-3' exonuclease
MILLDAMMQLYRCNYKLSDLRTRKDIPTGMEYGFLKGLEAFRRFWNDEIIICWEGKNNFRYNIDPNYKANRREKREKEAHKFLTYERIEEFKKLLSKVAENAYADELEADDVMASLAKQYGQKEKVIIYSGDKDLFQVLQNKPYPIHQCKEYQFRNKLWTPERIQKEFNGITPSQFPIYQAFVGDNVDNIKGVERVRRPLIAAAIRDGYSPECLSNFALFSSREIFALEEFYNSGQFDINLKLTTLKTNENISVVQRNWQEKEIAGWLKKMEFRTLKLCQQVNIEPTIEEYEEF